MPGGRKCEHGARARDCRRCSDNLCNHGKVRRWCAQCKPRNFSKSFCAIQKPAGRAPAHSVWLDNFGYFTSPELMGAETSGTGAAAAIAAPMNPMNATLPVVDAWPMSSSSQCIQCSAMRYQGARDPEAAERFRMMKPCSTCDDLSDKYLPLDSDATYALLSLHAGDPTGLHPRPLSPPASPCI
mmetsp:Transcript_33377/g.83131  ORF Transcript_33377/g.83131 Transcript_33377/m.83131 type:complete len:184 (-) Transcript_33377:425-976(-)